jgi:hypothetical protein
MKNALLLTLFLLCSIKLYGQEVLIPIPRSEYDNLKSKRFTDSLAITAQKSKIEGFEDKIKELEKEKEGFTKETKKLADEIDKLKSEISKVEKSELKTENERLLEKVEKLTKEVAETKKTVQDREVKLEEIRAEYESKMVVKKEEGIQSIKNQLLLFYEKPFDELLEVTSKGSIQRDIALLGIDSKAQEKLKSLQIYHESKLLLTEKYNSAKVQKVLEELNAIEQTEAVKKSIDLLSNYELRFEGLQETLVNIIQLNSKRIGFDNPEFTTIKYGEMINELTTYFYDYEMKLNEYPYLAEVITEIIQKKQIEIDADLSYLKERFN